MKSLAGSEQLLYIGVAIMAAAVFFAVAAIVIFRISGKRVRARLEQEFGKKRR